MFDISRAAYYYSKFSRYLPSWCVSYKFKNPIPINSSNSTVKINFGQIFSYYKHRVKSNPIQNATEDFSTSRQIKSDPKRHRGFQHIASN